MSNRDALQREIDQNLDAFKKELPKLMKDHRNRYALLKDKKIVGIYDTIRDAQTAAGQLYPDKLYSIQKVTNESIDLGYFSHAMRVG
jgi:hypothetical protein